MKSFKNALKISCVYIGTILGAGFASGQELVSYFARYGTNGMFGFLLSGVLFGIILYMSLSIIRMRACDNFSELSEVIYPRLFRHVIDVLVIAFMFIIFCTMLAGAGAFFAERLRMPSLIGVIFMVAICLLVWVCGVKGIVFINSILAPLLIIGIIILSIYLWLFRDVCTMRIIGTAGWVKMNQWIISSIIYVAYNCVTALVVVSSLRHLLTKKETVFYSGVISGTVLSAIGLVLLTVLLIYYRKIRYMDLPLLAIVSDYHIVVQYIYMFVLIAAMLTTAVSTGFGVIEYVKDRAQIVADDNLNKQIIMVMTIVLGILMSFVGFSNFVRYIYPLFGGIGLFEIIVIIIYYITRTKEV